MIGIICAMEIEARRLETDMADVHKTTVSGMDFVTGMLCGSDVVLAVCGIGKVAAAVCTQTMILNFSPDLIINTGVGGSLSGSLGCGDIAVATSVVQYDVDTTALGDHLGMISGINKTNFTCDAPTAAALKAIAERDLNCKSGVIASGDAFVADKAKKKFLKLWFGAIACDMESGAIGQTCYLNGVPFCIIRAISDNADGSSPVTYHEFCAVAADNAARILKEYIEGIQCGN